MTWNTEQEAARTEFRRLFAEIAAGAHERERNRVLPHKQIRDLLDAGFGTLRVPAQSGGFGLTGGQWIELLIELAEADSHIAHAFRGHFAFLEEWLAHSEPAIREYWINRVVVHKELIGNAWSERGSREFKTTVARAEDGTLRLNGEKHFSTGTIFADWIDVIVTYEGESRSVAVRRDAPGVTVLDDWDGFGQQLTGTGTTRFENVLIEESAIAEQPFDLTLAVPSIMEGAFQINLLAVLTGIARRAVIEVGGILAKKNRPPLGSASELAAWEDPLLQAEIGYLEGLIFAAEASTIRAAEYFDAAFAARTSAGKSRHAIAEIDALNRAVYRAQLTVAPDAVEVTNRVLDTIGASAARGDLDLDRFWRNARIISSHNSIRHRERLVGEHRIAQIRDALIESGEIQLAPDALGFVAAAAV